MITKIKSITHKLGLYTFARSIYRKINPTHRKEKLINKLFYRQLVSPGDLCFDIGSNVGQTIEALLESNAFVVAVEPNLNCIPVLRYQFKSNTNVRIIQKAIGAAPGFAELNFNNTDSTASIRKDWPFANKNSMRVEVTTLDSLIAEFGQPKFIKVDVEGFELEVFKGLSQAIPIIYFEMHGNEIQQAKLILDRLAYVGKIIGVNAVDSENSAWLLNEWAKKDQFIEKIKSLAPIRANIVVKMKV